MGLADGLVAAFATGLAAGLDDVLATVLGADLAKVFALDEAAFATGLETFLGADLVFALAVALAADLLLGFVFMIVLRLFHYQKHVARIRQAVVARPAKASPGFAFC